MTAERNRAKQPVASAAKARKAAERAELGRQMRAQGATNSAIANALGITVRQVQRLLKK
jgi:DNA invertase Pin-like site-specific DNA recombinase